jgi:regulator of protease activity HflC (stomatin/prohibitin superfamily)
MDFISAIFNLLSEAWAQIRPFFWVQEYDGAILTRFGKYIKDLPPGYHWKWPVIDEVHNCIIATETITVKSQSLTTKDDKNIVISAVVKCKISNPKEYLLKVKDVTNAISDITQGKIKDIVMHKTWEECRGDLDAEITDDLQDEAIKWGISVEYVTITDLAIIKTIRLLQE